MNLNRFFLCLGLIAGVAAKEAVVSYIEGKDIKKVIVVPGRLVNIVAV